MKPDKSRQTVVGKLSSQSEDQVQDSDLDETALGTISVGVYERGWTSRLKLHELDIWIAIGLYIALCGIAFMVL